MGQTSWEGEYTQCQMYAVLLRVLHGTSEGRRGSDASQSADSGTQFALRSSHCCGGSANRVRNCSAMPFAVISARCFGSKTMTSPATSGKPGCMPQKVSCVG